LLWSSGTSSGIKIWRPGPVIGDPFVHGTTIDDEFRWKGLHRGQAAQSTEREISGFHESLPLVRFACASDFELRNHSIAVSERIRFSVGIPPGGPHIL
jgi:hypothetical protein